MIIQIVLWDCYTVPYFCFEKRRFMEELKFEELELCPEILKAVKHMGFEEASPIQSKAIPVIMSGKDVIGQAQTGTGKTAAFGIPLLEKIDPFFARQESWQSRLQKKSEILQNICMG